MPHQGDRFLSRIEATGDIQLGQSRRPIPERGLGQSQFEVGIPLTIVTLDRPPEREAHPRHLVEAPGNDPGENVRAVAERVQLARATQVTEGLLRRMCPAA